MEGPQLIMDPSRNRARPLRHLLSAAIAALLLQPAIAAANGTDLEAARAEARGIVKSFAGRLQASAGPARAGPPRRAR